MQPRLMASALVDGPRPGRSLGSSGRRARSVPPVSAFNACFSSLEVCSRRGTDMADDDHIRAVTEQALEPKGASDEACRSGASAVGSWNRDNRDNPGPGRTEPDPSYGNAIKHPSARILGILRAQQLPGRFALQFGKSPGYAGLFSCHCFTILTLFLPRWREGLAIHG
jgi:hypothetical protein